MEDPAKPESMGTTERSAKQLLAWQAMIVILVALVWSFIETPAVPFAILGGLVVLVPNSLTYLAIRRTESTGRIVLYSISRSVITIVALVAAAVLFKTQVIPILSAAGAAVFISVIGAWFSPRSKRTPGATQTIPR